jgi:signal transduction histidine kinase
MGDAARLREVVENLIDNAVKFMGEQPHPRVEIGAKQNDLNTTIYVKDNGIGIDSMYYEKIFGLFERLGQNSEGTGIGLAIVKRIVESHGGRIWVESAGVGHGSVFFFSLPAANGCEAGQG